MILGLKLNADFHVNRKQVLASKVEAEKDNVKVPTTIEEYCNVSRGKKKADLEADLLTDFYDDDDAGDYNDEDDEDDDAEVVTIDDEDSGNGES